MTKFKRGGAFTASWKPWRLSGNRWRFDSHLSWKSFTSLFSIRVNVILNLTNVFICEPRAQGTDNVRLLSSHEQRFVTAVKTHPTLVRWMANKSIRNLRLRLKIIIQCTDGCWNVLYTYSVYDTGLTAERLYLQYCIRVYDFFDSSRP